MVRENAEGQTTGEVIVMVETGEDSAGESVPDRVEQVARDAGIVAFRGAEVVTNRRLPEVRRAALDLASVAGVAVALVTAFAFGNWAAASALSTAVRDWVAALILASTWIVVAVLLAALLLRGERSLPRNWRRLLARDVAATLPDHQQALDDAQRTLRNSLDQLAEAIGAAAEQKIAAAILPLAGGMVEVGEEMVDATDEVIEAADEITDVIEEEVPGGMVVNRAFDFALAPGRFGIRIVRTVLNLGQTGR